MCEQQGYSFRCILKEKTYSTNLTTREKMQLRIGREEGGDTRYTLNRPGNPYHKLAIK